MKIVTNEKLIKRNKKIGLITSIGSMVILGGGLYFSFASTNNPLSIYSTSITFGALILGFLLSQVGIFYGNRWGRSPRPDERIIASLKGLEDKYTFYNYTTGVPHLLVGPPGIWVLIPYSVKGLVTYDEKKLRWKHKGGNAYLKFFAQEGLGRPDLDASGLIHDAEKYIAKTLENFEHPPVQAALVFINERITVDAANAPVPTLPAGKLKDFFRKKAREEPAPIETIKILQAALPKASS
jgi:hypothetical protein